ncbi:unnamed protein product, partial [Anisakis simplex]|uniref:Ap endonuclease, putative (inferred by orthology to a S. mansoni protein) n=1 Tax=Anisakis simplex TaxID=6269 RepID=A0A0M3KKG0_ANISI
MMDRSEDCELPLGDIEVDNEGRAVIVEFHIAEVDSTTEDGDKPSTSQSSCVELQDRLEKLVIINVYCPRYNLDNTERFEFKLRFHQLLSARVQEYRSSGYHVIIIGDVNIAHKAIDH